MLLAIYTFTDIRNSVIDTIEVIKPQKIIRRPLLLQPLPVKRQLIWKWGRKARVGSMCAESKTFSSTDQTIRQE